MENSRFATATKIDVEPRRFSAAAKKKAPVQPQIGQETSARPPAQKQRPRPRAAGSFSDSLGVGAKTLAGVGLGLVAVVAGAAVIGIAAETVLVPSLLLKLAGGVAGGGVGMAKGLSDNKKDA